MSLSNISLTRENVEGNKTNIARLTHLFSNSNFKTRKVKVKVKVHVI